MPVQREPTGHAQVARSPSRHPGERSRSSMNLTTCALVAAWLLCALGTAIPASAQPYAYVVVTEARNDNGPARNRLLVIDTLTRTRQASIPLDMGCLGCAQPRGLAATPDGSRLFVVNHASNTLSVVDARTRTVIRSLPIGTPVPFLSPSLAISPDGARLYVLKGSTILVLDTTTLGLLATLQTAASANSRDILASPDNRVLYVTEALGRVLKLDAASGHHPGSRAGAGRVLELHGSDARWIDALRHRLRQYRRLERGRPQRCHPPADCDLYGSRVQAARHARRHAGSGSAETPPSPSSIGRPTRSSGPSPGRPAQWAWISRPTVRKRSCRCLVAYESLIPRARP